MILNKRIAALFSIYQTILLLNCIVMLNDPFYNKKSNLYVKLYGFDLPVFNPSTHNTFPFDFFKKYINHLNFKLKINKQNDT